MSWRSFCIHVIKYVVFVYLLNAVSEKMKSSAMAAWQRSTQTTFKHALTIDLTYGARSCCTAAGTPRGRQSMDPEVFLVAA
jgi:hypothetical protein